jgi:glutaredoxin-like protein NrdH
MSGDVQSCLCICDTGVVTGQLLWPVLGAMRVFRYVAGARIEAVFNSSDRSQEMTITVYSKPACVQCTATTRALDAKGLSYDVIDLTQDAAAMEMVQSLGYRQAPVVIAGEDHWAGFRPDMIGRLA